jgi:hypothetical protein
LLVAFIPTTRDGAEANADYWVPKLAANVRRARRNDRELENAGWTVLRFGLTGPSIAWSTKSPLSLASSVSNAIAPLRATTGAGLLVP